MDYLQKELDLKAGDVVEVTLDHPANVQLLDPSNFLSYQQRRPFRYYGGYARQSPVRIVAPRDGKWYLVVDLGGGAGTVRASVAVLSGAAAS
jgi:hypothetical protein